MDDSAFQIRNTPPRERADPSAATATPDGPRAPVPLPLLSLESGPEPGPGLVVGHAEDPAEVDADRRADAALARLSPTGDGLPRDRHVHGPGCDHLRRLPTPTVAPAVGYDGGRVPDELAGRIERLRGSGESLPAATRARMEEGFGASFSGVRLHVGAEPARLNRLVSAEAFTVGRDIFFGAGRLDPGSPDGERVLAHELAHTLQPASAVRRKPTDLAATPAATNADLETGDAEWKALREAAVAYVALAEDQYDARAAKIVDLDRLADAWEKVVRGPSTEETEIARRSARTSALDALRALVATEHRELAAAGVKADEGTQQVTAPRFKGDYMLEQVMRGSVVLKVGEMGLHVTKVQQALADLGYLRSELPTGTFDAATKKDVEYFQNQVSIPATGDVDAACMAALDRLHGTHMSVAFRARSTTASQRTSPGEYKSGKAPDELLEGTRDLSDEEAAAARDVVKTKQLGGPGGVLPTFVDDVPTKGAYEARLLRLIKALVVHQFNSLGKDKAGKRKGTDLVGWPHIEKVAARSKAATDTVFGKYNIGPPLKKGAGIHDGWDTKVASLHNRKDVQDQAAAWRVDKLLVGDANVKMLDLQHGAIQSRPAEKAIVDRVRAQVLKDHRDQLLETHKGWPGFASGGQINIQRFKSDDKAANRATMWRLFHTVVHEYLHTLEHSAHKAYQRGLGQQEGAMTLREGAVDYFTHTVLETVEYDDVLRREVEGEFYEEGVTDPIPTYTGYAERAPAEKLAGIVGARNVMAAFFLGDVAKIGKAP